MSTVNCAFLTELASIYVGQPVRVEERTLPDAVMGMATYEDGYVISLSEMHNRTRPGTVPDTFFHEVGHLKLGHIPAHNVQQSGYGEQAMKNRERILGVNLAAMREARRTDEAAATAWAAKTLSEFWAEYGNPLAVMLK